MSAHNDGGRPETVEDLRDVLLRGGFVPCDSPVCGCGSWHQRFGYPERMRELQEMLEEAGHPLTNANGNLLRNAVAALIAERDALRDKVEQQHGVVDGAWETQPPDLYNEIASVLNKHSAENKSNTPDYVLAHFVLSSLEAFDIATNRRSAHFNGTSTTGESA